MTKIKDTIMKLIFLTIGIGYILTGCWNYKEIDEMNIVSGAAIDMEESTGDYILTVEVFHRSEENKKISPVIFQTKGRTIFNGIRNLIMQGGKRLYWAHAQAIIIDNKIARKDILPVLDMVYRDAEMRSNIHILISKESRAMDILDVPSDNVHETISNGIADVMKNSKNTSKFYPYPVWRFIKDLYSGSISSTLPMICIERKGNNPEIKISGTGVFKKNKMVGSLDEMETRSFLWIMNRVEGGFIVSPIIKDKKVDIGLEIRESQTKITHEYHENDITMKISIKTKVNIGEIGGEEDFITEEGLKSLQHDTENKMKEDIEAVIKRVQKEYSSDIFGFGKIIDMENPQLWDEIKNDWDEIFSTLNIKVAVEVDIVGSSLRSKPIKIKE